MNTKVEVIPEKSEEKYERDSKRITWNNKFEFIFNVVGYNVGLGNIWRFAYLCFKNGGGAFLVPYILIAIFCGVPMMFMEVAIGQITKHGCIAGINNLVPMMRGIGYASIVLSSYFLINISVAIGWCFLFFFQSFTLESLPWATCDNYWNTEHCKPIVEVEKNNYSQSSVLSNTSTNVMNSSRSDNEVLSTVEFWNNYVLQRSSGIENLGTFTNWRIVGCTVSGWIMVYLCIIKGIRTTGKVAYLTVIIPYILMLALLVRGLTLEGAGDGIFYYITPNITRLGDPQVWLDAGSQVVYSLGVGFGAMIGFGSYNKSNFDVHKSSYLFVSVCCGSSLIFGFVVFSFLGHMASVQGKDVRDVVEGGPGLVFQVLPAEFALLPGSQFWSALFFAALLGLAADGSYALLEGNITALADYFPSQFGHKRTQYWRGGLCCVLMILGLPQLFDGGIYIFELVNLYGTGGICILFLALFEVITISWIYGIDRFFDDVKILIGYRPPRVFKYCLKFVTPTIILAIFAAICSQYSPIKMGTYVYPWWANVIGWLFSLSVLASIPFVAIKTLLQSKGKNWKQKWRISINSIELQKAHADDSKVGNSFLERDVATSG